MKIHRCGDRALLTELDDIDAVQALRAAIAAVPLDGIIELVPGARTLLVSFDPSRTSATAVARHLSHIEPVDLPSHRGEVVTIPVVYDGADLAEVSGDTGLSVEEVIAAHTGGEYQVAFGGFAPGFGYLTGLDPRLRLPRHSTPRTRVPPGAVAIADEFTGIYPRSSPGGWRLLGRTGTTLWDPARNPPALLRPGTRVKFRAVPPHPDGSAPHSGAANSDSDSFDTDSSGGNSSDSGSSGSGSSGESFVHYGQSVDKSVDRSPNGRASHTLSTAEAVPTVEVAQPGPLTTVQDLGRPGLANVGVGPSGAADVPSATLANRLVGNPESAACLEITFGGARFRFLRGARVAITGAHCPVSRDGRAEAMNAPFFVGWNETLTFGSPSVGMRTYLAVRGGIAVPATLGSRATDLLAGLGPAPLAAGDVLAVGGEKTGPLPPVQVAPVPAPAAADVTAHITFGPRENWFTAEALRILTHTSYTVAASSNRVGVRLEGARLPRRNQGELPSEGTVTGAIQVPPDGRPLVFLADRPVTGGYPVIAVVHTDDIPVIAQARPGQHISFRVARY